MATQIYKKKYDPAEIYACRNKTKYPKTINKDVYDYYNKGLTLSNSKPEEVRNNK